MLINIGDADKSGHRTLTVSDGDTELFKHVVNDTAHGHRLAKLGLRHGWDSDELAEATKAAAAIEHKRVEVGKKDAEPKSTKLAK